MIFSTGMQESTYHRVLHGGHTSAASCLTFILGLVGYYLKIYSDAEVCKDVVYWMAMTKHPIACGIWACFTYTVLQLLYRHAY